MGVNVSWEIGKISKLMCTKTSTDDYENLCRLDVLGVTDITCNDIAVFLEFKDQLRRSKDGWYKTGLIQKTILLHCNTAV